MLDRSKTTRPTIPERALVLDDDLQLGGLEVSAGEGELLPPRRVGGLLQVARGALEFSQLHLHVRVQRPGDVHDVEVARLDDGNVQVLHPHDHVVHRRHSRGHFRAMRAETVR